MATIGSAMTEMRRRLFPGQDAPDNDIGSGAGAISSQSVNQGGLMPPKAATPIVPAVSANPVAAPAPSNDIGINPDFNLKTAMTTNSTMTAPRDIVAPGAPTAGPASLGAPTPLNAGPQMTTVAAPAPVRTAAPVAAPQAPVAPPAPIAAPMQTMAAPTPTQVNAPSSVTPTAAPPLPGPTNATANLPPIVAPPIAPPKAMEDDSAASRLGGLLAAGSPLIDQARQQGLNAANKRGLLSSSIAVGAAQGEAYRVAAPLAMQDAQIAGQKNLAEIDRQAQYERLKTQLASAEGQQKVQIQAEMDKLIKGGEISSSIQGQTDSAAMDRLIKSGDIATVQQIRDIDAQMTRLQYSTNAADQQQLRDLAAQKDRLLTQGTQALAQIQAQGQIQFTLADKNNAAEMSRVQAQLSSSDNQQAKAIAADMAKLQLSGQQEMDRLTKQLSSADAQQAKDIQAQMDRLQVSTAADLNKLMVSGTQALQQISAQGTVQSGLQQQASAAEMDRLKLSLSSSDNQQSKDIAAQMERLQTSGKQQLDQIDKQIAAADGQQKADLQAQRDRLQTSIDADMQRLVVQGTQALAQIGASGAVDTGKIQLQAQLESALSAQGADQQQKLSVLQGDINGRLQAQTDTAQMTRLSASFAHDIETQSADAKTKLQQIGASGDQEIRRLVEAGLQDRETLAMNLANGNKSAIASSALQIFQTETQLRSALLSNPNMPASERAAYEQAISSLGDPVRNFLNALYAPPAPATGTGGGLLPATPTTAATPPATSGGGLLPGGTSTTPATTVPTNPQTGAALTSADIRYSNGKYSDPSGNPLTADQVQKIFAKENGGGLLPNGVQA